MRSLAVLTLLLLILPMAHAEDDVLPVETLSPTVFARIPFGTDKGAIAPFELGMVGEGLPTSFVFDGAGNLHLLIPHTRSILVLDDAGRFKTEVKLRTPADEELPAQALLYDMAFDLQGRYLILDRSGGWLNRVGRDGRILQTFGHNVGAVGFAVSKDGNVVVRDAAEARLNLFDPKGAFIGELRGPYLSCLPGPDGTFIRSRIIGFKRGFLWVRKPGTPLPSLLTVVNPQRKDEKLYQAEYLGIDDDGLPYVLTTESSPKGYDSLVRRLDLGGNVTAVFAIEANQERLAEIPRFFRLQGDGRLITFRTTATHYEVLVYDVGP